MKKFIALLFRPLVQLELFFKFLFVKDNLEYIMSYIRKLNIPYNDLNATLRVCRKFFDSDFTYKSDPLWGMIDIQDNFKTIVESGKGDCDEGSWYASWLIHLNTDYTVYQLNYFTINKPTLSHSVVVIKRNDKQQIVDWGVLDPYSSSDLFSVIENHLEKQYNYKGYFTYGLKKL